MSDIKALDKEYIANTYARFPLEIVKGKGSLVYDEALKTIPTVVQQIAAAGIARQGAIAASAVVLMIPPLAIFIAAQSNVMETMAHAGMKD